MSHIEFYLVSLSILLYNLSSSKTFSKNFIYISKTRLSVQKAHSQSNAKSGQSTDCVHMHNDSCFTNSKFKFLNYSVDWPKPSVDWLCSNSHISNRHHLSPKGCNSSSMEMTAPLRCNFSARVTTLPHYIYPLQTQIKSPKLNSNLSYISYLLILSFTISKAFNKTYLLKSFDFKQ